MRLNPSRIVRATVAGAALPLALCLGFSFLPGGRTATAQESGKVPFAETQMGMNQAASRDFTRADAAMNRAYGKLMRSLNQKTQTKLRSSQRQWLKFRDAEAEFRSMTVDGGSAYPMVYAGSRARLTEARTKALDDAYKTFNTEGNM
ncbi:MAG: DUF1311 domain-containing protein [Cytophagales bacterium]|nr:DUF1311 domain-containing protein [Armatimonadota bacterium]